MRVAAWAVTLWFWRRVQKIKGAAAGYQRCLEGFDQVRLPSQAARPNEHNGGRRLRVGDGYLDSFVVAARRCCLLVSGNAAIDRVAHGELGAYCQRDVAGNDVPGAASAVSPDRQAGAVDK